MARWVQVTDIGGNITVVNFEHVREIASNGPGTRLVFSNGDGFDAQEKPEQICKTLGPFGPHVAGA